MSGEVIEIEYQLTVDDYAKFSADRSFHTLFNKASLPWFLQMVAIGIFVPHFLIALLYLIGGSKSLVELFYIAFVMPFNPLFLFILLSSFLIYFIFFKFLLRPVYKTSGRSMVKRGRNVYLLSARKLVIDEFGLHETTPYSDFRLLWTGIESVKIVNGDVVIGLSSVSASFVPSRFFKSEEEKQRIYTQCVAWWESAQEKAT